MSVAAVRLQGLAEPNMVVIAQSTRKLLGNLFDLEDLGAKELKGIVGPMRAWAALRPSKVESRFEALHAADFAQGRRARRRDRSPAVKLQGAPSLRLTFDRRQSVRAELAASCPAAPISTHERGEGAKALGLGRGRLRRPSGNTGPKTRRRSRS